MGKKFGNPVCSESVSRYLKAVQLDQQNHMLR